MTRDTPPALRPIDPSMGWIEWAMLVVLSVVWGGAFFVVDVEATNMPLVTF